MMLGMLDHDDSLTLGTQVGSRYILNNETADILESMNNKLNQEDQTLRSYRRQLSFNQVIKTDLIPILLHCGDREDVFNVVIRLLVNLTVPMECLVPKELLHTRQAKQIIYELNRNLIMTKEAFLDTNVSNTILQTMSGYLRDKNKSLHTQDIAVVNNCLLLIRNILHIPDNTRRPENCNNRSSPHNHILWNLFRNNLDDVLLTMMGHVNVSSWCNTIVQIIALIYKDQHVVNLQKLLQTFIDSTLSESSDNESNTSPQGDREESKEGDCSDSLENSVENNLSSATSGNGTTPSPPPPQDAVENESKAYINNVSNSNNHRYMKRDASSELGEPPPKKYKEYWESFLNEVGQTEDKNIDYNTYSETDNMKQPHGNNSGHTSESSDITGVPKSEKRPVVGATPSSSDMGYVTQACNQGSTSSSSNEGMERKRVARTNPVKHKVKQETMSNEEKQELRQRKMIMLARQQRVRVKNMVNYMPSDEDISEILKEFTIDLLLTGEYRTLVRKLLEAQRECKTEGLDKSHILWLITYFLKFATQLEIGLGCIDSVLSVDTLAYVTYEGVEELETLELAQRDRETELDPYLRRIHLVVAALREFVQTMAIYKQSSLLSQSDKNHLFNLQLQSTYIKGVRQLLLLLIRSFNVNTQGFQYLTDLVVTNHYVLMNMEETMQFDTFQAPKLDIAEHLRSFANMELMTKFGQLLVNFQENSPQVNDCIFTVMHHVAGDLEAAHTLFIPAVLQTFSKILEANLNICPDWVDLIEYIIQKFLHTMQNAPHKCAATITENMDNVEIVDECGLTSAESSSLFYNFNQVEHLNDPVGAIIDIYRQAGNISLTRVSLIQSLLAHGIITHAQYMSFMYMKSVLAQCNGDGKGSVKAEVGSEHCTSDGHITDSEETQEGMQRENQEIKVLKDCLVKQGRGSLITWIQEVLLDACRVKLYPNTVLPPSSCVPHEPVAFHCNLSKQSIPLVPFSREQNLGLQTEAFILLLHKLGFLLPADVGKVYPRIPYFWSADHMYGVAAKLGPLPADTYRFTSDDIERIARKCPEPLTEKKVADDTCCDKMDSMDEDAFEDSVQARLQPLEARLQPQVEVTGSSIKPNIKHDNTSRTSLKASFTDSANQFMEGLAAAASIGSPQLKQPPPRHQVAVDSEVDSSPSCSTTVQDMDVSYSRSGVVKPVSNLTLTTTTTTTTTINPSNNTDVRLQDKTDKGEVDSMLDVADVEMVEMGDIDYMESLDMLKKSTIKSGKKSRF